VFSLNFPWLGKCCVLVLLDLYIYFVFPLARLEWSILLKSVRLPLQVVVVVGGVVVGCEGGGPGVGWSSGGGVW
jgi:hypothetical protein